MNKCIHFLILLLVLFSSCSQNKTTEYIQKTDTLVSLWNTDSCNYRKLTFILGDYELGYELQNIEKNSYVPYSKTMFGYDSMQNKNLIINSLYDLRKSQFEHVSKQEIEYDKLQNPIETINFVEVAKSWKPVSKTICSFDLKKNITSCESYYYKNSKFYPVDKKLYSFDSHNNPIEIKEYISDSTEQWIGKQKIENEFKDGLLTFVYTYLPDKDTSWTLVSKVEHSYNVESKRVSSISYVSHPYKKDWVYNVRTDYEYDSVSGKMTNANTFFWDDKRQIWKSQGTEDF